MSLKCLCVCLTLSRYAVPIRHMHNIENAYALDNANNIHITSSSKKKNQKTLLFTFKTGPGRMNTRVIFIPFKFIVQKLVFYVYTICEHIVYMYI